MDGSSLPSPRAGLSATVTPFSAEESNPVMPDDPLHSDPSPKPADRDRWIAESPPGEQSDWSFSSDFEPGDSKSDSWLPVKSAQDNDFVGVDDSSPSPFAKTADSGLVARGSSATDRTDGATVGLQQERQMNRESAKIQQNQKKRPGTRESDPLTQSLTMLATIAVMLLAARFVVPRIVEELRFAWHRGELRAEYEAGTEGLRNVSLDALSEAYQMVTAAVGPSVVHIEIQRRIDVEEPRMSRMLADGLEPMTDQGSGVVVDREGYVLTNRHVIADGEDITVTLSDGRKVPGLVVGSDALTDLALLKIEADRLIPITWGDSDRCKVGSPVWAVGSPFGLDRTVTFGILSGKHRMVRASTQYQDFMQSDVAVNPGNSGGPLVDARGTLVGINTAIVGDTYRGISFSIPSKVAKQVYLQLRKSGRVERGWLGVRLDDVAYDPDSDGDPRVRGARVGYITNPAAPAALAGVQNGDLILSVNQQPVENMAHLMRIIGDSLAGSQVSLKILRNSQPMEISVTLGSRPEELNRR